MALQSRPGRVWRPILLSAFILASVLALPTAQAAQAPAGLFLRTADAFTLQRLGASEAENKDPLPGFRRFPFGGTPLAESSILAFEENRLFTMVVGDLTRRRESEPKLKDDSPRILRRFFQLKPSTFVVDDEIRKTTPGTRLTWSLQTTGTPEVSSRQIRVVEGEQELVVQMLLPRNVRVAKTARKSGVPQAGFVIEFSPEGDPDEVRFVNVLHVRQSTEKQSLPPSEITEKRGPTQLTVRAAERTFQLTLPRWREGAASVAVLDAAGKPLVEPRPLASAILPHTAEGVAMIERWDAAYRGGKRPGWDTRRPSAELVRAVEKGTLRPGRVVELGCGSGTNAIYLAGRDFDVTAIDLAPTALSIAEKKAREAGVTVRWVLADVLAPPKLAPFGCIFDRGCYHGVRKQNAAGYVEALRRLSKPGTLVLVLAGNANEAQPHYGPPRVKEEEIRADFAKHFEIVELRETRFDTLDPKAKGALAWSVLLRRK